MAEIVHVSGWRPPRMAWRSCWLSRGRESYCAFRDVLVKSGWDHLLANVRLEPPGLIYLKVAKGINPALESAQPANYLLVRQGTRSEI
jgi:hypothetical protein